MLSAFTARPLVELKQRDKSKIESVLAYGDRLLVGLSTGSLRVYRVNDVAEDEQEEDAEDYKDPRPASQSGARAVDLLREQEKFSKAKIEQLALVKEADVLLCLSNNYIHLHGLQDYALQQTLTKSKGATTFSVTSNVVKDSSTGVNAIVTKLAVAVKRKLLVWTWHDGELEESVHEQTLVTGIKSLTWATATRIIAGLNASHVLVDLADSNLTDIVGPGSIGGAPGQDGGRLGATGVAGMSYLGMTAPKPLATKLGDDEVMLARDINTHFINLDGNSLGRRQIPWPVAPDAIAYSYPYLLALQASKGNLEIRNPQTLTLLQSVPLSNAAHLHVPNTNTSLVHAGKGFLAFGERAIWRMESLDYASQIDQLVRRGAFDEAISLIGMLEEALLKGKAEKMRNVKIGKAQVLFDEKRYRDAIDLFTEVNAPPERVISMFPAFIAGEATSDSRQTPANSPLHSPLTMSPKSGKSRRESAHDSAHEGKARESRRISISASHGGTTKAHRPQLEGKDLKTATEELRGFLVQSRTRMKKVLNPDGTLKPEGFEDLSATDFGSLLIKNTFDQSADQENILNTAKLIDTTLFRAYMFVSPSFVGPLFRIDNFCDPDVVNEKLTEAGRYNDLVDFFYGKKLHRPALELLERFGKKDGPDGTAPQLAGPQRTVAYLQNLPPTEIDLILQYAKWPLESDPDLAMEIFLADSENAESLPRDRVMDFLRSISATLSTRYLEHITDELNDTTPVFHQALAETYIQGLRSNHFANSAERGAWEDKTLEFLRSSKTYTPYKILALLTPDDPNLYEARALVLGNMGQHRQALEVYVFKLRSPEKAEEYCNDVYLSNSHLAQPPHRMGASSVEDESQPSIYHALLSLYLKPPNKEQRPNWPAALDLLAKHGARMPASKTLDLIPDTLAVQELEQYFRGQVRSQYSACNESRIVAGLRAAEAFREDARVRLGDEVLMGTGMGAVSLGGRGAKGRNRRVLVEDERVCGICYRRFGGSAIKVLPE